MFIWQYYHDLHYLKNISATFVIPYMYIQFYNRDKPYKFTRSTGKNLRQTWQVKISFHVMYRNLFGEITGLHTYKSLKQGLSMRNKIENKPLRKTSISLGFQERHHVQIYFFTKILSGNLNKSLFLNKFLWNYYTNLIMWQWYRKTYLYISTDHCQRYLKLKLFQNYLKQHSRLLLNQSNISSQLITCEQSQSLTKQWSVKQPIKDMEIQRLVLIII